MSNGETGMEFPKIRAQRPCIRMTDVFLGDDAGVSTSCTSIHNIYLSLERATSSLCQTRNLNFCTTTDEDSSTNHTLTDYLCLEEMEFAQHMNALGLPLSFGSSKSRSNVTSRSKRTGTKPKSTSHEKERNNPIPQIMIFSQMENHASSTSLQDSTNIYAAEGEVDAPCQYAKKYGQGDLHFDESVSLSALGSRNESGKKPVLDEVSDANSENLSKFEFSPDTVRFQLNGDVLGSSSLNGDSCSEENLEDACSRAPFHHDGDLLDKHDLDRIANDSSTSFCSMHLKGNTETCSVSAESPLCPLVDDHSNFICSDCADWKGIWDPFYKCYYFFNAKKMASTWHPPPCLEKYAFSCSYLSKTEAQVGEAQKNLGNEDSCRFISVVTDSFPESGGDFYFVDEQPVENSTKMEAETNFCSHYTTIDNGNLHGEFPFNPSCITDDMKDEENECKNTGEQKGKQQDDKEKELDYVEKQQDDVLGSYYQHDCFSEAYTSSSGGMDTVYENVVINKKGRVRKSQSEKMKGLTGRLSGNLLKYWHQRCSLFSKFNDGIKMDEESWYSVTPESIAKHHALRCGTGIIIDCFAGVGGNAIQFAMRGNHVIAIDVDPQKIDYARHNAIIYGVNEMIDFVVGDFFKIALTLKGDVAFMSPPWGGPNYSKMQTYDLKLLKPHGGCHLFKIARMIAAKVVMFLPRNVDLAQLADLTMSADPQWDVEMEKNYLEGRLKGITAYFNDTALD